MNAKDLREKTAREFFRIRYPSLENPVLEIGKHKLVIIDISEGGMKFALKKGLLFFEGDAMEGKVVFGKRGALDVKGTVLRVSRTEVAVQLDEASRIPLARIMEEQRLLIQKGKL